MPKENQPKEKLWTKQYVLLLLISFFNQVGVTMISPTLPKFAVSLGASLTMVGAISGVFAGTALIIRPFSGLMADRLDKKKILIVAAIFTTISVFGYAFSKDVNMLMFFRIIHGATIGISLTANTSLISENVPRSRLGEGISYLAVGMLIAQTVSPNLGFYIGDNFGYKYTFLIAAAYSCIVFALMLFLKNKKPVRLPDREKINFLSLKSFIAKEVLIYAAIASILSFANNIENTFLPLYADSKSIKYIGTYYTVSACVIFSMRLFAGKLFDKKGLAYVLYPGLVLAAIAMVIIGNANTLLFILLAGSIKASGLGLLNPALQASSIKKTDPSRSGVAASTYYIGVDAGQAIGPLISGSIASVFGFSNMFYFSTGLFIFGIFIYYMYNKIKKKNA